MHTTTLCSNHQAVLHPLNAPVDSPPFIFSSAPVTALIMCLDLAPYVGTKISSLPHPTHQSIPSHNFLHSLLVCSGTSAFGKMEELGQGRNNHVCHPPLQTDGLASRIVVYGSSAPWTVEQDVLCPRNHAFPLNFHIFALLGLPPSVSSI